VRHCCCPHHHCLWPCCCTRSLAHSNLAFDGLAKAAMAFFFSALLWCPCLHCTGVIASIKLSLLLALRRHCCRVGPQRSGWYSTGVCRRCAGVLPALRWHHCQHRAAVVVASIMPALSPLVHGYLCPHCAPLVVAFALPPSLLYMAFLPYPVSSTPVLHFLSPDALAAMHVPLPQRCHWSVSRQLPPSWSRPSPRQQRGVPSGALPLVTPALLPA
jgi:hypothetical protein